MAFTKMMILSFLLATLASFLSGCGSSTSESGTTARAALSAQYFTASDYTTLTGDCAITGIEDLGKKVPDSCCASPQTESPALTFANGGTDYTCAPQAIDAAETEWVRDFLGCVGGEVTFAEGCVPAALASKIFQPGGYPMNKSTADGEWEASADAVECNCGTPLGLGTKTTYTGTGCHVGIATFMLDNTTTDKTAFFAKVTGSC
mmetsp:Transcript_17650/g.30907  ORF Transcript_17650/g.30907 Transcript_17650/m.30907 type:complete len:205 (+) Transcript_17650:81-695(+)|eukprot:CAMPEP_0197658110 /NCGR_PEP_ID=MMETSP1338-20131121/45037_1 /TAXON_ID=43686 ORGANISM="Pelagodinium beii, Strain RCC1491" /NCGR_SAMPLE_ID=MMETSP1338 /ASSEMBLY_ACC=CAM_ASM_000754 /LENGTH=204 /DNA_ID=CAMNT_0043234623 /DNA_START=70 /DNA_END=684 /DNA_ORIENTATION=-